MKESMFSENESYVDMYCKRSTKEVKCIFRRSLSSEKSFKLQDNKKSYRFVEILTKYLDFQKPILSTWHYSYVYGVTAGYRIHPRLTKTEVIEEHEEQHRKILQYL